MASDREKALTQRHHIRATQQDSKLQRVAIDLDPQQDSFCLAISNGSLNLPVFPNSPTSDGSFS